MERSTKKFGNEREDEGETGEAGRTDSARPPSLIGEYAMSTKTLLKQDPAKPNAALDTNTAWSTGMDSSSLTSGRLGPSGWTSMTVSVEDAAAMRDSCSSSTIETTAVEDVCWDLRLPGSVWLESEWEKLYILGECITSSRANTARNAAAKDKIAEMRHGRT